MNPIGKDPLQRKLEILNWIILALLAAISLLFFSTDFTLGILMGGLISVISFSWRQRDLRKVFQNLTERARSAILFRYYVRFFVSAVLIYFIITETTADVIGLLIGLSIVIINIVLTLLASLMEKRNPEEIAAAQEVDPVRKSEMQEGDPAHREEGGNRR